MLIRSHIFLSFLIYAANLVFAVSAQALEPVILTDDKTEYTLGKHLEILEDVEKKLTAEEVVSPEFDERFVPSVVDVPNFGTTESAYWLRFQIQNQTIKQSEWILDIIGMDFNTVDVYELSTGGELRLIARTGLRVPYNEKPYHHHNPVVPLTISPGEKRTTYLRLQTDLTAAFPITLSTPNAFVRKDTITERAIGIYGGILLSMIFYNMCIFLVLRDKTYLYYVFYITASLLFFMFLKGVPQYYLESSSYWLTNTSMVFFGSLMAFTATIFVRTFLATARYTPFLDRVLIAFIAAWAVLAVVCNVFPLTIMATIANSFGAITMPFLLAVGVVCYKRGFKPAKYFMIAWTTFIIGTAVMNTMYLGILPYNSITDNIALVGSALEVILLSFALAYRIRTIEYERDQAQALATASQRLTRYFPKSLVEKILSADVDVLPKSERRNITIIFSDLVGFTDLTERLAPERISALLNEYLTNMTELIERHGGTLDKIMGDGIMALFGAPDEMADEMQAHEGVTTAVEMQKRLDELGENWRTKGIDHNIRLRIGVHQDYVTVGNFGSNERLSYTAIGDGVNFASRLEKACTPGNILVSFSVYALTKDKFPYGDVTEREFKGFARKQKVVELSLDNVDEIGE